MSLAELLALVARVQALLGKEVEASLVLSVKGRKSSHGYAISCLARQSEEELEETAQDYARTLRGHRW